MYFMKVWFDVEMPEGKSKRFWVVDEQEMWELQHRKKEGSERLEQIADEIKGRLYAIEEILNTNFLPY